MSASALLARLDGVKQTGPGRWLAKCPAHEDKRPSLTIRELDDGRVLLHDFGGCGTDAVLASVGLEMAHLFPEKVAGTSHLHAGTRKPFPASDILRAVAHEVHVAACAAVELAEGRPLNAEDHDRLSLAVRRLSAASEAANG